jgi:hypothetical protein
MSTESHVWVARYDEDLCARTALVPTSYQARTGLIAIATNNRLHFSSYSNSLYRTILWGNNMFSTPTLDDITKQRIVDSYCHYGCPS